MRTKDSDGICGESWDLALYAWATAAIFQARAQLYRRLIRALTFMGIIVPLLIGGLVLGFGLQASYLSTLIVVAVAAGIVQLAFSAWAVVYGWTDSLEYALESMSENFEISALYKELGNVAVAPPPDLAARFTIVQTKDNARRASDSRKDVSDKEKRYGHRAALRQFQRVCVGCNQLPRSMDSTDCPVCGRF
jgi:mobilome CxxCx(11)CxxC protein